MIAIDRNCDLKLDRRGLHFYLQGLAWWWTITVIDDDENRVYVPIHYWATRR